MSNSTKHVLLSKTIWVNLLAIIAFVVQQKYGFVIDETLQVQVLGVINLILRLITKEPVTWSTNAKTNEQTT